MSHKHITVTPGHKKGTVILDNGEVAIPEKGWEFLPAGDAAVTRRVKSKGETWVVQVRRGRRTISKGIWACGKDIIEARREVEKKRTSVAYQRQRQKALERKRLKHESYVQEFADEVLSFLDFHPRYSREAVLLSKAITDHATPVGSGTVARTKRIPVGKRAKAATMARLRHQTTLYDSMHIVRIKGARQQVRKQLGMKSLLLLRTYRQGENVADGCPLQRALHAIRPGLSLLSEE